MKLLLLAALCVSAALAKHPDAGDHHEMPDHYSRDPEHEGEHDENYDHEAVLGSKDAEEEFDKMDPSEAQERLGDLVDKMDKNSDGYVDKPELLIWIKNSFKNLKLEEGRKDFKKHDKNDEGFVTWANYIEEEHSQTLEQLEKIRKGTDPEMKDFLKIVADDEARFNAADQNKDKKLTLEEFQAFFHPQYYEHMFPYELERKLAEADTNKDGKIDMKEYIASEVEKDAKQAAKDAELENFKEHDKNNDTILDTAELKLWLMELDDDHDDEIAKDEVKHLFVESLGKEEGEKPNAKLTKDVITNNHHLWVGSHATDYGKRLEDEL